MTKPPVDLLESAESLISFSGMNVNQVKLELTAQLHDKEALLGKPSTSQTDRNALVKQTDAIRKELLELNQYHDDADLPAEIRSKLEVLANEGRLLKNEKLYSSLLPPAPSNSTPSKHRIKSINGAHPRKPDADFATEIGQGLLVEVRKLQIALQEKEEIIKQLELSRFDNERSTESIQHILKQKEEIEDRLKEELWDLEVANQELHNNLSESNQLVAKHTSEFSRLNRKLKSQSEQIDIMKAQEEKAKSVVEATKVRHEQEIFNLRRQYAAAQREKTQISKQMDTLNTELKICKAKLTVKQAARHTEEVVVEPELITPDTPEAADSEPPTAPQAPASQGTPHHNQTLETETLKQSLSHAHRIISNLRNSLHKEKLENAEIKKMLTDSQESVEQLQNEIEDLSTRQMSGLPYSKKKVVSFSKKKKGGIARKAKGLSARDSNNAKSDSDKDSDVDDSEASSENESFMDPQFALDSSFGNTLPLGSMAMKSLSSELEESKVLVSDMAINTDPVMEKALADAEEKIKELEQSMADEQSLRSKIEIEMKQDMIPKTQMDVLLTEAKQSAKVVLEKTISDMRISENEMKIKIENDLRKEMILRSQADVLIEEAIESTKRKVVDSLKASIEKEVKENMVERAEMDSLIAKVKQEAEIQNKSAEHQIKQAVENELKQTMMLKSELSPLLENARRETQAELASTMVTKVEAATMVSAATEPLERALEELKGSASNKEEMIELIKKMSTEEREKAQQTLLSALENQKIELEQAHVNNLEQQKIEMEQTRKVDVDKLALEFELHKKSELEDLRNQLELSKKSELEDLRNKLELSKKSELEDLRNEFELSKKSELEDLRNEFELSKKTELDTQKQGMLESMTAEMEKKLKEVETSKSVQVDTLAQLLDSQKKEYGDLKQAMTDLLTKDSVDVLISEAVTKATENVEREYRDIISEMVTKEESERLVADAIENTIIQSEQNKSVEEEQADMISKAEAEALAKVAAADAIVKERLATVEREKELISKEEADLMVQAAIEKYKIETAAAALAKDRKSMKEHILPRDDTGKKTQSTIQHAAATEITLINIPANTEQDDSLDTPIPSESFETQQEDNNSTDLPVIERSLSESKLEPPSISISPSPSVSTPTPTDRKLRLSSSAHSLRLGSRNTEQSTPDYGSVRVLNTSKYGSTRLHVSNLRDHMKKQNSKVSLSTMSSTEDRMPLPMRSVDGFSGFSDPSIDPEIISAITQTMIGEWMSKNTRRYVGGGISEKQHQRFFWIHPYTKTLYWSSVQPGTEGSEGKTKSAIIGSVSAVPSSSSAEKSPMSLLIHSSKRNIKITASSLERHDIWLTSLSYLLGRSNSLEEESRSITNNFVENAGQIQKSNTLKSRPSKSTIVSEVTLAQYDSDESEGVASTLTQHLNGEQVTPTASH